MCEFDYGFDKEKFISGIPALLKNRKFRKGVKGSLGKSARIVSRFRKNKELSADELEELYWAIRDTYRGCSESILTLGWDGDFPGCSGAIWISELEGIYMVGSSDMDDQGPYGSLDDALECECFNIPTAKPELFAYNISLPKLLEIAKGVVDWENGGSIQVNRQEYVVTGKDLKQQDS